MATSRSCTKGYFGTFLYYSQVQQVLYTRPGISWAARLMSIAMSEFTLHTYYFMPRWMHSVTRFHFLKYTLSAADSHSSKNIFAMRNDYIFMPAWWGLTRLSKAAKKFWWSLKHMLRWLLFIERCYLFQDICLDIYYLMTIYTSS